MSKLVNSLALNQEAIVTKPLKAQSLYNATKNLDASSSGSSLKAAKKTSTMDSSYAKVSRGRCHRTSARNVNRVLFRAEIPVENLLH